jgi:hypothetical protein
MGYKHSPANAKMSAFMNKMHNTTKSPVRQNDKGGMKTIDYGNDFSISVEKDDPRSDNRILVDKYNVGVEQYKQGEKSGNKQLMNEGNALIKSIGHLLRAKGLSTDPGEATKQLNRGGYTSASNIPKAGQDKTYAPFGD